MKTNLSWLFRLLPVLLASLILVILSYMVFTYPTRWLTDPPWPDRGTSFIGIWPAVLDESQNIKILVGTATDELLEKVTIWVKDKTVVAYTRREARPSSVSHTSTGAGRNYNYKSSLEARKSKCEAILPCTLTDSTTITVSVTCEIVHAEGKYVPGAPFLTQQLVWNPMERHATFHLRVSRGVSKRWGETLIFLVVLCGGLTALCRRIHKGPLRRFTPFCLSCLLIGFFIALSHNYAAAGDSLTTYSFCVSIFFSMIPTLFGICAWKHIPDSQ